LNSPPKIPFFFFSGCFTFPAASLGVAEVVIDDEDFATGGVIVDGFPEITLEDDIRFESFFVSVVPTPPEEKFGFSDAVGADFAVFSYRERRYRVNKQIKKTTLEYKRPIIFN
jgi:hypothetical protein